MFVIWSLGLGGAEQVVIRLAAGLDRRRFTPVICCMNEPGPFASQATSQGIEVIALHKRPGIDLKMLRQLTQLMKARDVRIVHAHLWGASFWGRLAARMSGVPIIIVHEHGMQPWRGGLHFLCDRWLAGRTNRALFASAQVMRTYQEKTGINPATCTMIPNGVALTVPDANRETLRQQRGWALDERVIISVGRLSPEKGYEDLLKAFALLAPRTPNVRLVLVGDGAQRAALQTLQAQLGLNGRVTFAGQQQDVAGWLAAADLYVQPSRREGLPLAVLEAMAAGVPVVATDVGDLAQVIMDGRNGYLVPAQQPEALAEKLVTLVQQLDRQQAVIDAAKALVRERYSDAHMVQAVERVYEEELTRIIS